MAAASVTPPGSLDVLQPGFSKTLLGTKLEDKYLCSACKNVLRRPFQAQCGHRYCSFCLSNILSSGPQNCAACVHEGIYEEGVSVLESSSVRGPEAEHPNEQKTRCVSCRSTRGRCPSAAGGFPRQCCPQGGGEPASHLPQRRLHLEGDPQRVRGRPACGTAPGRPPPTRRGARWACVTLPCGSVGRL
ncbi:E3 ubiquitin-protein ligase PRT1-like isoform X1 [Myotis lucifugus]|uniref:E3 ubiquitin-protein ligase PRT1-like isoform X1 n=1 Tax=Myotis lucifugus TaxID=59463 RepID=UPI000CCC133E|nr:E3 ubiquitin-protein ligase PRT1-like isoform X1 [Myotis lucifugus]